MKKLCFLFGLVSMTAWAQVPLPTLQLGLKAAQQPAEVVNVLQVLFLLTILTLAPAILIMMTSFSRIIVILSFLRQALGTTNMPPNQLLVGLALFLTFVIMGPTFREVNVQAIQPYLAGKISQSDGLEAAQKPIRAFMLKHTRAKDIELFVKISGDRATAVEQAPF